MSEGKCKQIGGKTPEELKLFVDSLSDAEKAIFKIIVHLGISKSKNCTTEAIQKHLSGKERCFVSHIKKTLKKLVAKKLIYRYRTNVWCMTDFGMKISHYIRDQMINEQLQRTGATKTLKHG